MKADGDRITMVTCVRRHVRDACADAGGADVFLVGDSSGHGRPRARPPRSASRSKTSSTTPAPWCAGRQPRPRGGRHAVHDLPGRRERGLLNAGRLLKEGGAESVKLEGGEEVCEAIEKMVRAGIPVMGHVGLTPQSVHAMGGFKIQGKDPEGARAILRDAKAIEQAGAYAIVLEGMPVELARVITAQLSIPTIGIGAGVECDGQVLVIYDLLGLFEDFVPKFVKQYATLGADAVAAIGAYKEEGPGGGLPSRGPHFPREGGPLPASGGPDPAGASGSRRGRNGRPLRGCARLVHPRDTR
jgi:3-methyl-2-oxobutanoate hydroxymethyltransferase